MAKIFRQIYYLCTSFSGGGDAPPPPSQNMSDVFHTIAAPSESKVTEKMSKFLSFAYPVADVAMARQRIAEVTRSYHDARHVCWAYMVGPRRTDCLSSDNGEPSGTAGKPILGQINSFGLTDVVVIVVRYFGGIKLGTSGLIAAYRQAAHDALESAEIIECHVMDYITFKFPYMSMNDVMKIVKQPGVSVKSQQFDNSCSMTIAVRADNGPLLRARLADIDGVTLSE